MNTCDADRVEQIRQAVLEQAHCELPVETIGHAIRRWGSPYEIVIPGWLGFVMFLAFAIPLAVFLLSGLGGAFWTWLEEVRNEGSKPRIGPERAPDSNRRKRRHAARLHD